MYVPILVSIDGLIPNMFKIPATIAGSELLRKKPSAKKPIYPSIELGVTMEYDVKKPTQYHKKVIRANAGLIFGLDLLIRIYLWIDSVPKSIDRKNKKRGTTNAHTLDGHHNRYSNVQNVAHAKGGAIRLLFTVILVCGDFKSKNRYAYFLPVVSSQFTLEKSKKLYAHSSIY